MLNPRHRRRRRSRRSMMFHNPRPMFSLRRRLHRRRRSNPFNIRKMVPSKKLLAGALKITAGVVIGFMAMPLINLVVPAQYRAYRNLYGVAHLVLGATAVGLGKKKVVKDIGIVLIAVGLYDLLQQNVRQLNLPAIPTTNDLISSVLPQAGVAGMGANYALPYQPMDASYEPVSASYDSSGIGSLDDLAEGLDDL
jgi:hypothetical protein